MKITIKQETHTEIVDGKATSDQSTIAEFDFNESEKDTSINDLVEAINKEFKGGHA